MAKKRVQVGQFQKRAQLQSAARLVDQYVAPPKTNRQAQIASALEQAVPALQKYQETQLEKDLNEIESKVLKEVNSGNLKSLLSTYDEYREESDLVRNTYAKKRYEQTIAPLAARRVGSELANRYDRSNYAQSTNPNDYQKFLNENLDDILSQYSGSFSESTGGLADFQRSINPYINQFQQRFTEEAIRNNKAEETDKLQVLLSQVKSPTEAREWLKEARATGILSNIEIDTIIFNQTENEINGIDGKFSNDTFNAFKDLKVGNTGQIYGKKFTEGSGIGGKLIEKFTNDDIIYKQRMYNQDKAVELNKLYTSEAELIITDNRLKIEEAFDITPNMPPEVRANRIRQAVEKVRSDMKRKGIPDGIINEKVNSLSSLYDKEKAIRETSPEARAEFTAKYNEIVRDGGDINTNLSEFLASQYKIMTIEGYSSLVNQFDAIKKAQGSTQAKTAVEAIKKEISRTLGAQSTLDLKNNAALAAIFDEIDNILIGNPDIATYTPKEIYDYILATRTDGRKVQTGRKPNGEAKYQELPEFGELTVTEENSSPSNIIIKPNNNGGTDIKVDNESYTEEGGNQ
jgi:hypothetical protein